MSIKTSKNISCEGFNFKKRGIIENLNLNLNFKTKKKNEMIIET